MVAVVLISNFIILLCSIILFLLGVFFLVKAILSIEEKYVSGLLLIIFAFFLHFVGAFVSLTFIYMNLNFSNGFWLVEPILNFFGATSFLLGARQFYLTLERK